MTVSTRETVAALLTAGLLLANAGPVLARGGVGSHAGSGDAGVRSSLHTGFTAHRSPGMAHTSGMAHVHYSKQATSAATPSVPKMTSPASSAATQTCSAAALTSCGSQLSTDLALAGGTTPTIALTQTPFPAAAPAAPPALTAPAPAALAPIDAVDSSSGGTSRTDGGAAGPTLAQCMAIWEPALDMTKSEWKSTCARTLNGVDLPEAGTQLAHATTRAVHHKPHRVAHASGRIVSAAGEQ